MLEAQIEEEGIAAPAEPMPGGGGVSELVPLPKLGRLKLLQPPSNKPAARTVKVTTGDFG